MVDMTIPIEIIMLNLSAPNSLLGGREYQIGLKTENSNKYYFHESHRSINTNRLK
jgi:hypothetical protein